MTEELLKFKEFDNDKAFVFAEKVQKIRQRKKLGPVRIRVRLNGDLVFQFIPTGKKGDEWLNRKEFMVLATGHSSLYIFDHPEEFPALTKNSDVVLTGGGYPLYIGDKLSGALVVSGLEHRQDHELIIQAIKEMEN